MRAHVFREQRKALKLTQEELADALDLSKRQIGRYESGRATVPARTALAFEALIDKHAAPKRRKRA